MNPAAAVRLEGVAVDLDDRRVLGPIDLEVRTGEYVVVVGRSGAGKTTLLRSIAGLVRPSAGRIVLDGRLASDGRSLAIRPEDRAIGFVFQGGGLWPHLSVERTLDFVLRCRKVPRDERRRRVGALLEEVELSGMERRLPGTLSGGEAQRLALARALAVDPVLLLLDEPLAALDSELRGSMVAVIAGTRARRAITTLHVTHDPSEVAGLAARTVRIGAGKIVASPIGRAARPDAGTVFGERLRTT